MRSLHSPAVRSITERKEIMEWYENKKSIMKRVENADIGPVNIDECYKPWLINGAPPAARPEKIHPWKCGACGMENITGRFCPQCGSPRKE